MTKTTKPKAQSHPVVGCSECSSEASLRTAFRADRTRLLPPGRRKTRLDSEPTQCCDFHHFHPLICFVQKKSLCVCMLKRRSEEGRSTSRISSVFSSSSLKRRTAVFSCEKQQTQRKVRRREAEAREELLTGFGYACSRESDKIR